MTTTDTAALDGAKLEAFVGQAVVDMGAAISGLLLHLGDALEQNLNPVGRTYYGLSTVICTPGSLAQEVGLGLGAQAGERQRAALLHDAGFSRVRRAAETPFNIILEAKP